MPAPPPAQTAPADARTAELALCLLLQTVRVRRPLPELALAPEVLDAVLARLGAPGDGRSPGGTPGGF